MLGLEQRRSRSYFRPDGRCIEDTWRLVVLRAPPRFQGEGFHSVGVEPLVTPEVELNRFFFLGQLISLTVFLLPCFSLTAPAEKHQ